MIDHESPYNNSMVMDEMMLSSVPPSLNVLGNNTSMLHNEHLSYELGLIGTTSNASSMSQLASPPPSLSSAGVPANSYSFKHPLSHQHLYWLNGEQDLSTMRNGPSSSTSKRVPIDHNLQGDSNSFSALVRLHSETQQVITSQTTSMNQFNAMGVDDFRQSYQLASGLNWYPT